MNIFNPGNDATFSLATDQRVTVRTGSFVDVFAVSGLGLTPGLITTLRAGAVLGPYAVPGVMRLSARVHAGSYGITDSTDTKFYISPATPDNADGKPDGAVWIQTT